MWDRDSETVRESRKKAKQNLKMISVRSDRFDSSLETIEIVLKHDYILFYAPYEESNCGNEIQKKINSLVYRLHIHTAVW